MATDLTPTLLHRVVEWTVMSAAVALAAAGLGVYHLLGPNLRGNGHREVGS